MLQPYLTICNFPDWGFAFPPSRAFADADHSWELSPSWSSFPFLPWIPKLIPYLPPLSKYHLFWNPSLTTSSPNWGKGLSNVFPWQPGLKYISDNTEMFLLICLYSWGYLESCECICSFLPHQCLTQWSLQNINSEEITVKLIKKNKQTIGGGVNGTTTIENCMTFLKQLKIWPNNSTPGYIYIYIYTQRWWDH